MRLVFTTLLVLFLGSSVHAQSTSFFDPLTLSISPDFPEPNSSITARVESNSIDLDRSSIAWSVNGDVVRQGSGLRETALTVGDLGDATIVRAVVTSLDGETVSIQRTIRPAEVDILWEAKSYAPPLYQGKHLVSSAGVRVQALARLARANGSTIPPNDIVYTWRRNGALVASASGRGKSQAEFPSPLLFGRDTIAVEAASLDGSLTATASVTIASSNPLLVLYQQHPLFGVLYHQAVQDQSVVPDTEATFAAVPYFAPIEVPTDSALTYSWRVNGSPISADPTAPHLITLNANNSTGAARIELSLADTDDIFFDARRTWNLLLNGGAGGRPQEDPFQGGFFPGTQ
jgi:hypothetical protein